MKKNTEFIKKNIKEDQKKNGNKYKQPYSDLAFPNGCN